MEDPGTGQGGRGGSRRAAVGIAYILVSAACFGCMPIFARLAYRSGVDVATLATLRFTLAAACMWALLAWKGAALPRGRGLALLVAMGALGYAGQAWFYFTALTLASVGLVTLLFFLYPAIVTVLSRLVLRHPLTRLQAAAVAIALAGSALTVGRAGDGKPLGIALALLASLAYSGYIVAGTRIPREITPIASSVVVTTVAAAIFTGAALVRGPHFPATASGWWAVLGMALVCGALAIPCFFEGLERVGPVRTSVFATAELVVALALASAVLGEPFTPARAAGAALIAAAVVLLAREELRSSPGAPAPMRPGPRLRTPAAPPPTAEG
jgi:drug/metabolite transporter (DMT)-like permease